MDVKIVHPFKVDHRHALFFLASAAEDSPFPGNHRFGQGPNGFSAKVAAPDGPGIFPQSP